MQNRERYLEELFIIEYPKLVNYKRHSRTLAITAKVRHERIVQQSADYLSDTQAKFLSREYID